jgi:hypothetical protein
LAAVPDRLHRHLRQRLAVGAVTAA